MTSAARQLLISVFCDIFFLKKSMIIIEMPQKLNIGSKQPFCECSRSIEIDRTLRSQDLARKKHESLVKAAAFLVFICK